MLITIIAIGILYCRITMYHSITIVFNYVSEKIWKEKL
jgi:hypothetical protein